MVREILHYLSPGQAPSNRAAVLKTSAVFAVASVATMAQALPTSIGRGHSTTSISSQYTYGWLGTYLRIAHQSYLVAPATTTREIFWLPLTWNLLAVLALWGICIAYAPRAWRR